MSFKVNESMFKSSINLEKKIIKNLVRNHVLRIDIAMLYIKNKKITLSISSNI